MTNGDDPRTDPRTDLRPDLRPAWEYTMAYLDGGTVEAANQVGADGWELVHLEAIPPGAPPPHRGHQAIAIFKRRKLLVLTATTMPAPRDATRHLTLLTGAPHEAP